MFHVAGGVGVPVLSGEPGGADFLLSQSDLELSPAASTPLSPCWANCGSARWTPTATRAARRCAEIIAQCRAQSVLAADKPFAPARVRGRVLRARLLCGRRNTCDDGKWCTHDRCASGECRRGARLSDADFCTVEECSETLKTCVRADYHDVEACFETCADDHDCRMGYYCLPGQCGKLRTEARRGSRTTRSRRARTPRLTCTQ